MNAGSIRAGMNGFVKMITYSGTDFCCLCVLQKRHEEVIVAFLGSASIVGLP